MLSAVDRATRAAYDVVAPEYAALLPDLSAEQPQDRALLAGFAQEVLRRGGGPVADLGCGTGRVAADLTAAGLQVVGLDLSAGMLRTARALHPSLPLAAAHAGALPVRSGALAGLLSWYSLIHLPPEALPGVLLGVSRVLRPGAPVLLGFQSGAGERVDRTSAYGRPVPLTSYRHDVAQVTAAVEAAGLHLRESVLRAPAAAHESTAQAFLLAVR